jgi:hypothetical protein
MQEQLVLLIQQQIESQQRVQYHNVFEMRDIGIVKMEHVML